MTSSIDAVIVHYTGPECLRRCVDALHAAVPDGLAIAVVDNDAPDPVPEEVAVRSSVTVHRAGENLGFGRGVNLGAQTASAPYLLVINPDVLPDREALDKLRECLDADARLAACAPALVAIHGTVQMGSAGYLPTVATVTRQAFPIERLLGGSGGRALFLGAEASVAADEPVRVDWLSGACQLVRRSAFEQVGGFDERFFLYGEDIDLGKRLREAGWELGYLPTVRVAHSHAESGGHAERRAPDHAWLDGLDRYYRLHAPRTRRLLHAIGGAGFALRALAHALPRGDATVRRRRRARMVTFMRRSAHHALAAG